MPEALSSIPSRFFSADGKSLSFWGYAFLVILCVAFFIPGLVTLPPTDRDESSFAQASKQMIETSNYVDIRLQDEPRYKKPIGIYWLQTASVRLLNVHHLNEIWAYRIPSFLGATLAVVMTAALGSLLFGPMTGFLAALMMAGCVVLNVEARLAKTDAALLACVMITQYALARAYLNVRPHLGIALAFWTALGVGILIKGPIILLVLASTLVWVRLTDKNLSWFVRLKPVAGFFYTLLLVAPWFIAILLQSHGAFIQQSAGQDLFAKLWQGQNRGIMPPGLHLLAFSIVFFPFSLFAFLSGPDAWKNRAEPAVRFCLGWIIPAWILFELSLTKLPHYVMPLYPPIAILTAKALLDGLPALAEKNWRYLLAFSFGLWLMIGTGFAFLFSLLPFFVDHIWNPAQLVAGAVLIFAQGLSLFLLMQRKATSVLVIAIGSLIFMSVTLGDMLPKLQNLWLSRQIVHVARAYQPCDRLQIISASYSEPSLVFMAGTTTKFFHDGALAAAELKANPCEIGVIDTNHKDAFANAFANSHTKPALVNTIDGLNLGYGHPTSLSLYTLPAKQP